MMPAQWRRQDSRTEGAKSGKAKAGGIEERFKQYDKNGDGKLTPAEFPLSSFKQADKNNDGVLTLDEVKAYFGGRRQKAKQEE
jgi:Ca2+-binding EF-hand superfamily protein